MRHRKSTSVIVFFKITWPLVILMFVLIGSLTVCLSEAAGNNEPAIRVGSEVAFPPFAIVDKNGQADGFSVDLIKAVADTMGFTVVMATGPWDAMWNGLVSGTLDALPIVAKSPDRGRLVDFSLTHTETFDSFFVRRGDPEIPDIKAAEGKTIVVMKSDAPHHELVARDFKGKLVLVDTIPDGLHLVASGKHDAFLCSKLIGVLAIKKHEINDLAAGPIIPDYKRVFAFAVKKGDHELLEKLNQGLLIVKSNGEYNRIYEKWLTVADPWIRYRKYLLIAPLVATVIALAAIFLSAALNILVKRRTAELMAQKEILKQEIIKRGHVEKELRNHKENLEVLIQARTSALRESEQFFKTVIQTSPLGIGIVNAEGNLIECNAALLNLIGYDREELLQMNFADFTHPDDLAREQELIQEMWKGQTNSYKMEKRYIHKNKTIIWINVSAAVIIEDGNLKFAFAFIEDITERRRVEEKLQEYSEHLEKMVEERTQALEKAQTELLAKERLAVLGHFAGSISHELRNPLAVIDSSVYLLRMKLGTVDEKLNRTLARITNNVKKSTVIIESLLNLSRMEKPKAIVEDLIELVQESLKTSKIPDTVKVIAQFPQDQVFVHVEREQIRMALKNIIKNAVQAMNDSGTITVSVKTAEPDQVEISIADTGPGISPEHIEKIFEPLFSTKTHGIGFGLSITKMIVENHGGMIRAESGQHGGAVLSIALPFTESLWQ